METKVKTARHIIEGILGKISSDYNLELPKLLKYLDGEPELNDISFLKKVSGSTICKARKQDGQRCTRRCKDESLFCGKHIKNQKFGCVQDTTNTDTVTTDELYYNDTKYLIDDDNIVYQEKLINGEENYEIVGKRTKSGKIKFLKELVDTNLLVTDVNKSIDLQMMFETPGQKMLTGDC